MLGMRDWLFPGSKIIITTRREDLLRAHEVCVVHRIEKLDHDESMELFSLHAFGKSPPPDEYVDSSKWVVHHCDGLPLAIEVLGSSLFGKSLELWRSQLEKLKAIPHSEILEKLKISYDTLQDDHDRNLFLHLACFFVGTDKDCTITILDECEFYTAVGIQNLIDRCLLIVDRDNKVVMHHLLQKMGREIVRQESPNEPGERSRLCNHKDSFNVLRQNTGTRKIEGLTLDMSLLKEDKSARRMFGVDRKHSREEFFDNSSLSNVGNSLKRYCFGMFSWTSVGNTAADSNQIALATDAFAKMHNLKLLQLGDVHINGSYENFPKEIRWLCWRGFPFESIPSYFPLEIFVALEMPYSRLKNFWDGTKFLKLLKILNLSHSHSLAKTPDFILLPNLERLVLEDCTRLVEIHDSIGHLERLVLLNLKDCRNLRKLPRNICSLKSLGTLDISGCLNLENLPTEMGNMDSLTVLRAGDVTGITRSPSTTENVKAWYLFIWQSPLKPRKNIETSWASSLPQSLVKLSLVHCNLSDDAFPTNLRNLTSLQHLDLTDNPITRLPDCVKGLTGLQELYVSRCTRLRSLVVPQDLFSCFVMLCCSLEKVTILSQAVAKRSWVQEHRSLNRTLLSPAFTSEYDLFRVSRREPYFFADFGCENLVEVSGIYKLEPIGNVDKDIVNNLGLFDLESMGNLKVMLSIPCSSVQKLSIQGCHEEHVFYTYLPGSEVPGWFNLTNKGSSLSFMVPQQSFRIRGLSLCTVYKGDYTFNCGVHLNTVISNATKRMIWSHCPLATGIPTDDEDMMWLSYWKFENQVEGGDELNISVFTVEEFQVKEVGVHLVYDTEKSEKVTQQTLSTSGEVSGEIERYGVAVPGNASSYQEKAQVFALGPFHLDVVKTIQCGGVTLRDSLRRRLEEETLDGA